MQVQDDLRGCFSARALPPAPSMALMSPVCAGVEVSGASQRSRSHVCSRPLKSPVASFRSTGSVILTSCLLHMKLR